MERSILEHLERNLVTRKEKSEVLKIATSSKISESLDANANCLPCLGLGSSKSKNQINNRSPAQWNEDRGKSFSVPSPLNTIEAKNVNRTSASEFEAHSTIKMFGTNAGSSLDLENFKILKSRLHRRITQRLVLQKGLVTPLKINRFWLLFLSASLSNGGYLLWIIALVSLSLFLHLLVCLLSLEHLPSCHHYQVALCIDPKRNIQGLHLALAAQTDLPRPFFFFPFDKQCPYPCRCFR